MDEGFAQRLIKARSGHGWSQADLAEVSGVAAAQISRYEAGKARPRPEVVAKLAKALAVEFEWLREGTGPVGNSTEVPRYPSTQKQLMGVELDAETLAAFEQLASRSGLTTEMLLKQLILLMANNADLETQKLWEALRELRGGN